MLLVESPGTEQRAGDRGLLEGGVGGVTGTGQAEYTVTRGKLGTADGN